MEITKMRLGDRQAAGSKKVFLCDSGMVNTIGRVSQGQLFEQSVYQNLHGVYKLTYYNKEGSGEIDFIADSALAIEAKFTMSQQDAATLKRRSAKLNLKENYVISHEYSNHPEAVLTTDL